VATIQGSPQIAGIPIGWCGIFRNGAAVIRFHRVDNAFESDNPVQKLGMFREEDLTDQGAGASGALAAFGAEIARNQRIEVGQNAKMAGTLAHAVEDRSQSQSKTRAEFRRNDDRVAEHGKGARVAQADRFVQGDTEGKVGVTQFASVGAEKCSFGFRQEGAPVLLNRIILAGRVAGTQGLPPEARSIYPKRCTREVL